MRAASIGPPPSKYARTHARTHARARAHARTHHTRREHTPPHATPQLSHPTTITTHAHAHGGASVCLRGEARPSSARGSYAVLYGPATWADVLLAWALGLVQAWLIVEPITIAGITFMPFIFENERIVYIKTKLEDMGFW